MPKDSYASTKARNAIKRAIADPGLRYERIDAEHERRVAEFLSRAERRIDSKRKRRKSRRK